MDVIVVGVDGTADSLAALAEAARLGDEMNVGLVAVFVRHENLLARASAGSAVAHDAIVKAERSAYSRAAEVLATSATHWRFDVREGDPATELVAAAREHRARAILVGGRPHGLVGGIAVGSVAQRLVRLSPVSLVVVRPGASRTFEASADPPFDSSPS